MACPTAEATTSPKASILSAVGRLWRSQPSNVNSPRTEGAMAKHHWTGPSAMQNLTGSEDWDHQARKYEHVKYTVYIVHYYTISVYIYIYLSIYLSIYIYIIDWYIYIYIYMFFPCQNDWALFPMASQTIVASFHVKPGNSYAFQDSWFPWACPMVVRPHSPWQLRLWPAPVMRKRPESANLGGVTWSSTLGTLGTTRYGHPWWNIMNGLPRFMNILALRIP